MNDMKKINLVLIIAAFFVLNTAFAQDDSTMKSTPNYGDDYRKIRIGIYGDFGLSYLKPKANDYVSDGIRGSYSYGLVVDYNLTRNYTFSTGVRFSSYGGKLMFNDTIPAQGSTLLKYRVNYLEIPLALKLKTNDMGYFKPFVQIGLNNGFRLSASTDNEFTATGASSPATTENVDAVDLTSFYRLSLEFGIGSEFSISQSLSAFAILTFQNGLTNSLTGTNWDWTESKETKNSAMFKKFALTVGLMF